MTRIHINGLGRIGRTVLRAWAQGAAPELSVVGVNDVADPDLCAYLLAYDSTFGPYPGEVTHAAGLLSVDSHRLPITRTPDPSKLDLSGVDVVLDCTGRADDPGVAQAYLAAGAGRVLISGPAETAELTVVLGANEALLKDQRVVSNASCTTNALAPLVRVLDDTWGIAAGWMTTIHCYTSSQPAVDAPRGDMARSRAGALSMVPTTTSAMQLLDQVLPQIAGRIEGAAVRVPVASVSAVDLTVRLNATPDVMDLHARLAAAGPVIGTTTLPLVSSDLRARPESLIVALPETRVTAAGLVRVFGWYDNEWGFSRRMLDVATLMG